MLEKIIQTALLVPMGDVSNSPNWGIPLILWGNPGIGKSERIEVAAASVGLKTTTVYPGTIQPEDVSGVLIPQISLDGKYRAPMKELLLPLDDLLSDQEGLLFLDEMSGARPAVQGALLGLILTRRLAGKQLPSRVRIIAAGNPPETAAGGWELEAPMANRFCHIDVTKPTTTEWATWVTNGPNVTPFPFDDGEKRILASWNKVYAVESNIYAQFMRKRGDELLYALPQSESLRGRAWPSPRTWNYAVRCSCTAKILGNLDVEKTLVEGCVGEGPAKEFFKFRKDLDLPDVEDVLTGKWFDTKKLDVLHVAFSAAVNYVVGTRTIPDVHNMWCRLRDLMNHDLSDIAMAHSKVLSKAGLGLHFSPETKVIVSDVLHALGNSGVMGYA
jgi:hypothetical protein